MRSLTAMRSRGFSPPGRQRGVLTLIAALGVLLMVTIVTLMGAEVSMNEQRVAANEQRQRQAFEAAQAGYEYAVAFVAENGSDATLDASVAPAANRGDRFPIPGGGTMAVELCDADSDPSTFTPTGNCTAPPSEPDRVMVYARGWSDDETGLVNIVALLANSPGVANAPGNPLTTRGAAVINGSGDVTNPEGYTTIWSGQSVDLSGGNYKTNILSPTGVGVVETSNGDRFGFDIIQNDGGLSGLSADEFFENWFGVTPLEYYQAPYWTMEVDPAVSSDVDGMDGTENEVIWVEGNLDWHDNSTVGTFDNPVIVIVNGDLAANATITVNGLLYVHGSVTSLNGNFTVNGAVIVGGSTTGITGSLDIFFDSSLLDNLGGSGRAAVSPGSWKDWI